jgi:phosphopantetheinyl transferase
MTLHGLPDDVRAVSIPDVWADRARLLEPFSPFERSTFDGFHVDKRKQDWLAGRVAAKCAVERATGLPMSRIEIRVDTVGPTRGRPYAALRDKDTILGVLSITHAGWIAAATFSSLPVGLDLELVMPRDESFEQLAFLPEERTAWSHLTGAARDNAVTRAWCFKEAVSKWRGCGLTVPFDELLLREDPTILVSDGILLDGEAEYCWARINGPMPKQPTKSGRSDPPRYSPPPRSESFAR